MARLRHRKWFQRTILFAMAALLWSQLALAGHGGCLDLAGTSMAAVADTRHGHDCESKVPSADKALCDTHCNEGGISANSGRIPPIPPLFVGAWLPWFSAAQFLDGLPAATSARVEFPPKPAWHRPTVHPAALLLI